MEFNHSLTDDNDLDSIIHVPDTDLAAGLPAVVMVSQPGNHRQGPNGLYTELARLLEQQGYVCARTHRSSTSSKVASPAEARLTQTERDTLATMDFCQQAYKRNRFILCAHRQAAESAMSLALQDQRIVGICLLDSRAFRTRSFYVNHWLLYFPRKLLSRSFWKQRLQQFLYGPEDSTVMAATSTSSPDDKRYRVWRLIQRGVKLHLLHTGGLPLIYNNEHQWTEMYGDLVPADHISASWLPQSDTEFQKYEQRELACRKIADWINSTFPVGQRSPLKKAA